MSEALLSVRGVGKSFGAIKALGPVDLDLEPGERLGIIGPNGSGKTTLINCISGFFPPDTGSIRYKGRDITHMPAYRRARLGLSRSFQIPRPFTGMTVIENLLVPMDYGDASGRDELQRAADVLDAVGLARRRDDPAESLSQLELRKLELARALAASPDILIADEAMAGLSEGEIDEILTVLFRLNNSGVAVIMIEHIMHAVMQYSERVICLETGQIIAEGKPEAIVRSPMVQKVYFGEQTAR
ncbi:ABC transporter ATP-binding protein [Chelativorans sp. AA-79]|uniref:ABC transporter ATP-binding protein n=1 Tax=Chelativorans sp. AA-79 TaxID=3028735 RepID=UPI0023F7076F|nr:ABC transporter ATP-binding protein [Chelativorans sp. AA-79]WEX11075.1 ABC transporter ATP-binding protein [Chelativorans sp. AA-79]